MVLAKVTSGENPLFRESRLLLIDPRSSCALPRPRRGDRKVLHALASTHSLSPFSGNEAVGRDSPPGNGLCEERRALERESTLEDRFLETGKIGWKANFAQVKGKGQREAMLFQTPALLREVAAKNRGWIHLSLDSNVESDACNSC